jgi:hypothetical protein
MNLVIAYAVLDLATELYNFFSFSYDALAE